MTRLTWLELLIFGALLTVFLMAEGCATSLARQVPAYPNQGQTAEQVARDQAECTTWATSNVDDPGQSAVASAGVGAVILGGLGAASGAAIYALFGLDPAKGAMVGAALGGLYGAAGGAASAGGTSQQRQRGFFAACMAARNYVVGPP